MAQRQRHRRPRNSVLLLRSATTPAAAASSSDAAAAADSYGTNEKVLNLSDLLAECDDLDEDLLEDDDDALPVWEHEHRVKALPFTEEELREREVFLARQQQQQQEAAAQLWDDDAAPAATPAAAAADPLAGLQQAQASDIASAYTAEQGFREMSVEELSVALTAGGLVDLVLDVRSHSEFAAGPAIPSAVNIPLDMLSDVVRAGQLDPYSSSSIAVVCASGQRSAQATVRLSKVFGFKSVVNVTGGMAAWQRMQAGMSGSSGSGGCGCGGGGGCH